MALFWTNLKLSTRDKEAISETAILYMYNNNSLNNTLEVQHNKNCKCISQNNKKVIFVE